MPESFTPDPTLFPFQSRWSEGPAPIHYVDEGAGLPILFFHGNPTWSFLYRHIILSLRDRFRCIAFDYPGFGLSAAPESYGHTAAEHAEAVWAVVQTLDLDRFVVMGQDWGGPIGLWIASQRPETVAGLVLGNTWFWPTDRLANKVFSKVMSSPPMQTAILRRNFFVERLIPLGTARTLSDSEMDHYRMAQPDPVSRRGAAEFPRQLLQAAPWLRELEGMVTKRLADKPVLLTWGMKDLAFPPRAFVPRIREVFNDAELVELSGAKHFIQEDAPDQIADAITSRFHALGVRRVLG